MSEKQIDSLECMSRIRIVLVRPQVAGNIGAVARLMENFKAGQLFLVNPKAEPHSREALHRSMRAEYRLLNVNIVGTLAEALEGTSYVIGTSKQRGPVHQPEDLIARDLAPVVKKHLAEGDVTLLFGAEDTGLSREELLSCDCIVQIPAQPDYPTLNLSHAVAVCLYEIFVGLVDQPSIKVENHKISELADAALMNRLMDKLQHALNAIGYLHPDKPDHLMFPIRAILSRARLTRTEAQILIGLAQQIDEFAVYGKPDPSADE